MMIEIIPVTNGDEEIWQKYFELSQEISRIHYPGGYRADNTLEKFRKMLEPGASYTASGNFIITENSKPSAWLDMAVVGNEFYFGFDLLSENVPEKLLKSVLSKVNELMQEYNFNESEYFSQRETIINAFKDIDAPVSDEMITTRLNRADMNLQMYKDIVNGSELNGWKLECYTEIPADIIDDYINCMNEFSIDISTLNPFKRSYPPYTAETWKEQLESYNVKGMGLLIYILSHSDGKIAGMCSVFTDAYQKQVIRHNGGITGVTAKHRGKGIGKYLKAKMHLKLLEENKEFEYITTDTMPWNKHMFRINEEIGFKPYRKASCFKITREFLQNYINLN